jgi:hypothetical protein
VTCFLPVLPDTVCVMKTLFMQQAFTLQTHAGERDSPILASRWGLFGTVGLKTQRPIFCAPPKKTQIYLAWFELVMLSRMVVTPEDRPVVKETSISKGNPVSPRASGEGFSDHFHSLDKTTFTHGAVSPRPPPLGCCLPPPPLPNQIPHCSSGCKHLALLQCHILWESCAYGHN